MRSARHLGVASGVRLGYSLLVCAGGLAHADGHWNGAVVATSDYVFRGISRTYGGAALQASLNYRSSSGWFAGAWGSNADPYPYGSDEAEFNAYAGFGVSLSPVWTTQVSYTRYFYAWNPRPKPYDYDELSWSVAFQDRWVATVSWAPDTSDYSMLGYVRGRSSVAYEVTLREPIAERLALLGGVGYYDLTRLYRTGYWAGDVGLAYARGRFEFNVLRFFADAAAGRLYEDASADGDWVATAVYRF